MKERTNKCVGINAKKNPILSRRERKLRRHPHIIKYNGDIKIGDVTVTWGTDVMWFESVRSILEELILWKKANAVGRREFAVRCWSEGPDYLLVEYSGELSILEMGSPKFVVYERIMPMKSFAGIFVGDLAHFLTDEGKRKRWRKPWLPKNGKLAAKQLLKMVDEYNGKFARPRHSRRGAARVQRSSAN